MFALKLSFITVFSAAYIIVLIMTSTAADALILLDIFIMKSSPQVQPLQVLNPAYRHFLLVQLLLVPLPLAILPLLVLLPDLSLLQAQVPLALILPAFLILLKVLQEPAELVLPARLVQEYQELAAPALQEVAVRVLLEAAAMVFQAESAEQQIGRAHV